MCRDAPIAIDLLVQQSRVAEVRREQRELVGAVASGLHRRNEVGFNERNRAFDLSRVDAICMQRVDLLRDLALQNLGSIPGRAVTSTTRRSLPFGRSNVNAVASEAILSLSHERAMQPAPAPHA